MREFDTLQSKSIVGVMGTTCEVHIQGFHNVENDIQLAAEVSAWVCKFLGEENVIDPSYRMVGRDYMDEDPLFSVSSVLMTYIAV